MIRNIFSWLLQIDSADEDTRRRGRNVVILSLGMITLCLLFMPLELSPIATGILIITVVAIMIYTGVFMVARRGLVTLSAIILLLTISLALFGSIWSTQAVSTLPFYLILPLLVAGLTIRPWLIWVVLAGVLVGLFATILALPSNPRKNVETAMNIYTGVALLTLVALMSFLGAKSTSTALDLVQHARQQAEAAHQLSHVNADLEATVTERTTALQSALHDVQARSDEQAQLLDEIQQQRILLRDLSVPVIPISASTLIMPLVGALDSTRLQQIQEQALRALEQKSARHLVLDITGVPIVDSQVAMGLLSVVQAARLLGAPVLLVGIRPEVAQAIVGLGLDLRDIFTTSDLQSALNHIALN